jgi:hypothetical protein
MISDVPAEIAYLPGHKDFMLSNTKPVMHGVLNSWQLEQLANLDELENSWWQTVECNEKCGRSCHG